MEIIIVLIFAVFVFPYLWGNKSAKASSTISSAQRGAMIAVVQPDYQRIIKGCKTQEERVIAIRKEIDFLVQTEQKGSYWLLVNFVSLSGLIKYFPDVMPNNDDLPCWAKRAEPDATAKRAARWAALTPSEQAHIRQQSRERLERIVRAPY